ncbi:hypothetical protein RhiJN_00648 [Ceratobasidium sp. AG-Ba]|nr:hypothetical protein RhiJN_00648 [Ceratobasidium sp. AG-Ba]
MPWQKTITLSRRSKGCHLVTDEVTSQIQDGLKQTPVGVLHLFIQHTSAALTVNENYDPDVRKDMTMALDQIVPESMPWLHTDEGPEYVTFYLICTSTHRTSSLSPQRFVSAYIVIVMQYFVD